jgi:hypothetical protein
MIELLIREELPSAVEEPEQRLLCSCWETHRQVVTTSLMDSFNSRVIGKELLWSVTGMVLRVSLTIS